MSSTTSTFSQLGLSSPVLEALNRIGYHTPTPVQVQAIPMALAGKDILASAQTGTGKTLGFGLPLIEHLRKHPQAHALVLTPTRELATQVWKEISRVAPEQLNSVCLIGGEPMQPQFRALKRKPRLFVATPGRLLDHLERSRFLLANVDYLVLDETDRMLDMGFEVQLRAILKELNAQRQTLMFSATLPKNIIDIARTYMRTPERVSVGEVSRPAQAITQEVVYVGQDNKYDSLLEQVRTREGTMIVFVKTKRGADKLAKRLVGDEEAAQAIHGDLAQRKRERVLSSFRHQRHRILVATDVAARGLDISHVSHVINYDMPQSPEDYVHRIGRTARAGAAGCALNLVGPADQRMYKMIQRFLGVKPQGKSRGDSPREQGRGRSAHFRSRGPAMLKTRQDMGERRDVRRA